MFTVFAANKISPDSLSNLLLRAPLRSTDFKKEVVERISRATDEDWCVNSRTAEMVTIMLSLCSRLRLPEPA